MQPAEERYATVVLPFVLAVAALTLVAVFSLSIAATLRAYVGGESHWSKGQKAAIASLQRYLVTNDEQDYRQFQSELAVPLSDLRARRAMERPQLDWDEVRAGFQGGLLPHGQVLPQLDAQASGCNALEPFFLFFTPGAAA